MARTVTLQTLQNRVLQRADLEYGSASVFLQSGELLDCINEAVAEWYDLFVHADGPFYLNSVSFQTTSGTSQYDIGSGQAVNVTDFYKGKGVDVQFGGTGSNQIVTTARSFMWTERNRFRWLPYSGWIYSQPVFYSFTGKTSAVSSAALDSIFFIPQPNGTFNITLWYYPVAPTLANSGDTIDDVNGSSEIIVCEAASRLLIKQQEFEAANFLLTRKEQRKQALLESLATRDAENPPRVQDVSLTDGWISGRIGGS